MVSILMQRVGRAWQTEGVTNYLLRPEIPQEQLRRPIHWVIVLATIARLRRERPFAVAFIDQESRAASYSEEDKEYVRSVPMISTLANESKVWNVNQGDVSPFLPLSEDEFLLLAPSPVHNLPRWPEVVTSLDAILLNQVDEYLKLQTVDPRIRKMIDGLSAWHEDNENRRANL